jgi:hypothetical protein
MLAFHSTRSVISRDHCRTFPLNIAPWVDYWTTITFPSASENHRRIETREIGINPTTSPTDTDYGLR